MGTWASVYGERAGKDGINFQEKPPPPYVLSKTSATMPTFVGISAIGAFDDDAFPKATHTHNRHADGSMRAVNSAHNGLSTLRNS